MFGLRHHTCGDVSACSWQRCDFCERSLPAFIFNSRPSGPCVAALLESRHGTHHLLLDTQKGSSAFSTSLPWSLARSHARSVTHIAAGSARRMLHRQLASVDWEIRTSLRALSIVQQPVQQQRREERCLPWARECGTRFGGLGKRFSYMCSAFSDLGTLAKAIILAVS